MPITHLMCLSILTHVLPPLGQPILSAWHAYNKKKRGEDIPSKLVYVKGVHKCIGLEKKKKKKKKKNKPKKRLTNSYREVQEGGIYEDGIRGVE